jgi:dCTP deaminase
MTTLPLRFWAEKFNEKLEGALTQYLIGNKPLDEVLVDVVENLYPRRDLTEILSRVEDKVETLYDFPEHAPTVQFLEKLVVSLKEKMEEPSNLQGTREESTYGILSDQEIGALAAKGMIVPYAGECVSEIEGKKILSYGLSSYGYDPRIGNAFQVFSNVNSTTVDPKNFDPKNVVEVFVKPGGFLVLPPHGFALGHTVEKFCIPRDLQVCGVGKSTYTRCGLLVTLTPLEPEWEGAITVALSNTSPIPVRVYAGEGICQLIFSRVRTPCRVSYRDRRGKYQGATGVVPPKVDPR